MFFQVLCHQLLLFSELPADHNQQYCPYKIPADRKLPIDKTDPSNQIKVGKSKIKYLPKLKKLLSDKQVSAIELTELALQRINETNDKTNAFLYVAGDTAIEEAKNIDKKIADGEDIGPLGGIPTSIKDLEPV